MSISAMLPTFTELEGVWLCTSRCLCSHGYGTISGTGPTRKLAYAAWVSLL